MSLFKVKNASGKNISDYVRIISNGTFENAIKLISVNMSNVIEIGYQAFLGDNSLKSVNLSSTILIDDRTFSHIKSPTSINLPNTKK
ncbi:leucine-rich repeat protein [Mycoplasma zalophi]|uniref:leucine-rich repeat protein n=1 Tax=Mycoplasma zalophi TaxID=191287 RepID=UPI001C11C108|nr:leucine-rich repeat protein [Mycoplasma zalophi]MBU4690807.1 leucine-rich repeat domain-containing protein [Mycoplasma zalophi]